MTAATPASTRRLAIAAAAVTAVLLVLHLLAAAHLELMFDEAYYTLWSRHLAWGYYDHPPLIAAWIRASTVLFGDGAFGVRSLGIVATALGSVAVYTVARDVLEDARTALLAVLLWNATPLIGIGAILATPDTPLVFGWTTALWGLGRLYRTGDWRWWLLIGTATGVALEAKYTALFIGPGLVLAMLVVRSLRRWWTHPGPYVGGVVALALFAPNIVWNAEHGWETFAKQFGRVANVEYTLRYVVEFAGGQFGLFGPLTFVLAVVGVMGAVRGCGDKRDEGRRLLLSQIVPLLAYFLIHSTHDRVQPNWLAPLYPPLAILAADAAVNALPTAAWTRRLVQFARHWAVPLGLTLTGLVYTQALLAPASWPARSDPTALLFGWRKLATDVIDIARAEGAGYILTQGYALNSLLQVNGTGGPPVLQYNERARWTFAPVEKEPDATRAGLFVVEVRRADDPEPRDRFAVVREVARLDRLSRSGAVAETYVVYRLERPKRPILDADDVPFH